jgi:hypothetical protein
MLNNSQIVYKYRFFRISLPLGVRIRNCKGGLLRGFRAKTEIHLCVARRLWLRFLKEAVKRMKEHKD